MFPNGFVNWEQKSQECILTGPIINEMGDGTGNYNKQKAFDEIVFQILHGFSLCRGKENIYRREYKLKIKGCEVCIQSKI